MKDYVNTIALARKSKIQKENQLKKDVEEFLRLTKLIDSEIFATNFVKYRINKTLLIENGYFDVKLWDFNIASDDGKINDKVECIDRMFNLIRNKEDVIRAINKHPESVVDVVLGTTGMFISYREGYVKIYLYHAIKPFLEEWGFNIEYNKDAVEQETYLKLTLKDVE